MNCIVLYCNNHNNEIYKSIENFINVLPLNELSDHSKIITVFKESLQPSDGEFHKSDWKLLNHRFKWDTKQQNEFKLALLNYENEITQIDELSQIDGELIYSTGKMMYALYAAKSA